jgi:hypothetical protein
MNYVTPAITELGAVADFTRADWFAPNSDGTHLLELITGTNPSSPTS